MTMVTALWTVMTRTARVLQNVEAIQALIAILLKKSVTVRMVLTTTVTATLIVMTVIVLLCQAAKLPVAKDNTLA